MVGLLYITIFWGRLNPFVLSTFPSFCSFLSVPFAQQILLPISYFGKRCDMNLCNENNIVRSFCVGLFSGKCKTRFEIFRLFGIPSIFCVWPIEKFFLLVISIVPFIALTCGSRKTKWRTKRSLGSDEAEVSREGASTAAHETLLGLSDWISTAIICSFTSYFHLQFCAISIEPKSNFISQCFHNLICFYRTFLLYLLGVCWEILCARMKRTWSCSSSRFCLLVFCFFRLLFLSSPCLLLSYRGNLSSEIKEIWKWLFVKSCTRGYLKLFFYFLQFILFFISCSICYCHVLAVFANIYSNAFIYVF